MSEDDTTLERCCVLCGLHLEGVHPKARCPQCRSAARYSVAGRALEHSALAHLRTLRRGWLLVVWGLISATLSAMLFESVLFLLGEHMSDAFLTIFFIGMPLWMLASMACLMAGWWLLSARDPDLPDPEDGRTIRKWVRVVLVILIALMAIDFLLGIAFPDIDETNAALALGIFDRIVQYAHTLSSLILLRWIASRAPSLKGWKRATRAVYWMLAIIPCVATAFFGWLLMNITLSFEVSLVFLGLGILGLSVCALVSFVHFLLALRSIWLVLNPLYKARVAENAA